MEKNMETTVAYLGYIRDNVYVCGGWDSSQV